MLSGKKLLLLGFIVVLLVVIPLTVYLVRQQQKLGAGAAPQTNISFSPPSVTKAVGELVTEDINITTGGNEVSFIKLTINFDTAKLQPTAHGATLCPAHPDYVICPSALFPNPPLQGPTVSGNSISITLSVGSSPTAKIVTTVPTKIATVNFKALEATTTPTQISFATASDQTQVLSIASGDQFNENVLVAGNPQPANVTITGGTATPTPGGAGGTGNKIPICTALNLDRAATGTAPYAITFTAIGDDSDGTVSKVTFQFGDGGTSDVTTGGGIGTASINTQASHQYNNAGSFTAKAILTDNQNGVSNGSCTQAITVNAVTGGPSSTTQTVTVGSGGSSATPSATPIVIISTPIPTPIATPQPTLAPTGPGDKIISLGTVGIIFSIIGAVILFAL